MSYIMKLEEAACILISYNHTVVHTLIVPGGILHFYISYTCYSTQSWNAIIGHTDVNDVWGPFT